MSYTEMFLVPKEGEFKMFREFSNSWHGAMLLWNHLSKRYLRHLDDIALFKDMSPIWKLVTDERLTKEERIALATTFDHVLVERGHLALVAAAIDSMTQTPNTFGHWGSWPDQAGALRELALDPRCFAVAWNQTSVNADAWWVQYEDPEVYDEDTDIRNYDLSRDSDRHWWLFEHYPDLLQLEKVPA